MANSRFGYPAGLSSYSLCMKQLCCTWVQYCIIEGLLPKQPPDPELESEEAQGSRFNVAGIFAIKPKAGQKQILGIVRIPAQSRLPDSPKLRGASAALTGCRTIGVDMPTIF